MTTITEMLAQIADDANRFDELKELARESHNIEIDGVYCIHTGRLIGRIDREEIEFAAEDENHESEDDLIDALVVRAVASMRPSPALNKPDRLTVANLCAKRPVDGLAFLVNRLYGNRTTTRERNEHSIQFFFERIHTNQQLAAMHLAGRDLSAWTHWLLELDTKLNLHDMTPPTFEKDRLGKWLVTKTGMTLMAAMQLNDPAFLTCFESWVFNLLADFEKGQHNAQMQAAWQRGNQMTGPAYTRSWIEHPEIANRKLADEYKRKVAAEKRKAKPVSEKTKTKNARFENALALLDMIETTVNESNAKAVSKSDKPAAKRMTVGMLFKKKES